MAKKFEVIFQASKLHNLPDLEKHGQYERQISSPLDSMFVSADKSKDY